MTSSNSELIDAIDLLNEVDGLLEAAFLAAAGLQMKQETRAMQAVIGKGCDVLKMALQQVEAIHEQGGSNAA